MWQLQKYLIILLGLVAASVGRAQEKPQSDFALRFEGNRIFPATELSAPVEKCLARPSRSSTPRPIEKLEYCLSKLESILHSKGYLQARVGKPQQQESEAGLTWLVPLTEGRLYRLGEVHIEGSKLLLPNQMLEMLDLKTDEIADASRIEVWLYERVAKVYRNSGYWQFTAEVEPSYHVKANAEAGIADLNVTIDEGPVFTIRSINFDGRGDISNESLLRQMLVTVGEVFKQDLFEDSLKRISEDGQFETIDADRDVELKTERDNPTVDLTIHLKKKIS